MRTWRSTTEDLLASLPDTFRYPEALGHVSERQLRRLIAGGTIIPQSRGLYRKSDWPGDKDLIEIAARHPMRRSACARLAAVEDISVRRREGSRRLRETRQLRALLRCWALCPGSRIEARRRSPTIA